MQIGIQKRWIPGIIFLSAWAAVGITARDTAGQAKTQAPPQPVMTEQDKRKAMERLYEQLQKTTEAQKQGTAPPTAPAPAPAQAPAIPSVVQRAPLAGGQVQLSYDNADLYDFINQLTDTLGISPVVIDPEVKGSVTIHSSMPMSNEDILPLFNLILKNNNAALVKQGSIYQIVPKVRLIGGVDGISRRRRRRRAGCSGRLSGRRRRW